MALEPITAILDIGNTLIQRFFPDPTEQEKAKLALLDMQQKGELQELASASGIVQTEAASEHWLTSTWRPIIMLTFGGLIVAYWMGWTAPNLSVETVLALLDIVKIGLGGYVIGRSAEKGLKMASGAIAAFAQKKSESS